jgi:hypothetical protein
MSVVVPFPGAQSASRGGQRNRSNQSLSAVHPTRAGSVISWVRPASCECCGRPTLAARQSPGRMTLCGHCSPPNIA